MAVVVLTPFQAEQLLRPFALRAGTVCVHGIIDATAPGRGRDGAGKREEAASFSATGREKPGPSSHITEAGASA